MMAGPSVYDGIISPQGGIYKPGPEVVFPNSGNASGLTSRSVTTKDIAIDPVTGMPTDALALLLVEGSGKAGLGTGMRASGSATAGRPGTVHQPNGFGFVNDKDQSRLPSNAFGYGTNGVTGADEVVIAAIPRNAMPDYRGYVAKFRETPIKGGGLMGIRPGVDDGLVYARPGVDPWAGMRGPADRSRVAGVPQVRGVPTSRRSVSPFSAALAQILIASPTSATYVPTVGGAWGSGQNTGPGSAGWAPGVITHDWNTTGTAPTGTDLSFATRSQQTSSRWNTDY